MVFVGIIGLLGGPTGVLLGGLLDGLIGHELEKASITSLKNRLDRWKNLRKKPILHVKE
jgi:hypothetical protein